MRDCSTLGSIVLFEAMIVVAGSLGSGVVHVGSNTSDLKDM